MNEPITQAYPAGRCDLIEPMFPEIIVKVRDLLYDEDPWPVINRCAFAAKRAGMPSGLRMLFEHECMEDLEFWKVLGVALRWFNCGG